MSQTHKWWWALAAILLAPILAAAAAAEPERPNIVFVLADDLGINDLSCYGRKDQPTPNLDKLATQGMRFTSAYCAQPICSPSRAAIMTGRAPARLHLTTFLPGRPDAPSQRLLHPAIVQQLPLEEVTLAELLHDAGYATACIGKWHLGGPNFSPEKQGFEFVYAGQPNTKPSATEGGKGEYDLTAKAIEFIEKNKERPFFLYLAHNNPHIPLAAQEERVAKHKDAFNPLYAAVIETLDDSVGRLLAKLDELKLAEKTIVVFTSDNGGLHVPEGAETPATHNTPFRAGKGYVYEGGLRIPLIVRWPGHVPAGKTCESPTVNLDWLPTFAELCGLKPTAELDGISVTALLRGETMPSRTLYWHFPHYTNQGGRPAGAMRQGDWKLIEPYDATDGLEFYNLADDPGETKNLAEKEAKWVKFMEAQLAVWRVEVGAQENKPNPQVNESLFKKIYVDVDTSRLKPEATAAATRAKYESWRADMQEAVGKGKKGQGAEK